MLHFEVALRTTVLLVDDDTDQLELRGQLLKLAGFAVLTADSAAGGISILEQHPAHSVHVAVLDYDMPVTNGCVLADYLKARYPDLKIILHSGSLQIPESGMRSIDGVVPKGDGVARLLEKVANIAYVRATQVDPVIARESLLSSPDPF